MVRREILACSLGVPKSLLSTAECGSKAVVGLIGDWGLRTRTGMIAPVAEGNFGG